MQSPEPEAHDQVLDNSRLNWNLEMLVFEERGKPGDLEKPLRAEKRTNNKLKPHMTPGPGIEPGTHWWEVSALTTVLPLLTGMRGSCSAFSLFYFFSFVGDYM